MHTVKLLQSSSSCTKKTMMKEFGMQEESGLFFNVALCVCVWERDTQYLIGQHMAHTLFFFLLILFGSLRLPCLCLSLYC